MGICRMEVARIQAETSRGALLTGAGGGGRRVFPACAPQNCSPGGPSERPADDAQSAPTQSGGRGAET